MTVDRAHVGEILVSAAPLVFRADWSLLLELSSPPRVAFATPTAPNLDTSVTADQSHFRPIHASPDQPIHHPTGLDPNAGS
jgi:hypothetical protein